MTTLLLSSRAKPFPVNGCYHATAVLCESECGSWFSHFTAGWFSSRCGNGQWSNTSFPGYQKVAQSICFIAAIVCVWNMIRSLICTFPPCVLLYRRHACFYCDGLLQSSHSSLCVNALWTLNTWTDRVKSHEWMNRLKCICSVSKAA